METLKINIGCFDKILLATEAENLESKIAKRFGEDPFYLIYNSDTKETESRVNPGHDNNHPALIDLVKEGVLYFNVGNTGSNAFDVLNSMGAKLPLARGLEARETLKYFLNNGLEPLTEATLKRPIREHQDEFLT